MKIILTLILTIVLLVTNIINKNKKENYSFVKEKDCNNSICNPSTVLNPILLALIPQTLYNSDGITITIDKNNTKSYVYINKDKSCLVRPITIVLTTFCDIVLSKDLITNITNITNSLEKITLKNVYVSAELFIDCESTSKTLRIKNLFVDISHENPQTTIDTGNDLINHLLGGIINNNSHSINYLSPDCNSTNSKTCSEEYECTALFNKINSFIKKENFPVISINSEILSSISLICGG